jgi:transcriptional regulator with XRE-family HTH domain
MVRDLRQAMRRKQVSQALLARRISTSRSAIGRLLKAEDSSLTLRLLGRIAVALDARVNLQFAERGRGRRASGRKKS